MTEKVAAVLVLMLVCWSPLTKAETGITYNHFGPGMVVYWSYTAPEVETMRLDFWSGNNIIFHISVHYGTQTTPGVWLDWNLSYACCLYHQHAGVLPLVPTQVLSLNSYLSGVWGSPEWHSSFPLTPGKVTSLTIVAGEDRFSITGRAAGNESHCEFSYRAPVTEIREIKGSQRTERIILGKVLTNYQPGRVVYVHGTAPDSGSFLSMITVGEPGEPPVQDIAIAIRADVDNSQVQHLSRVNNMYSWLKLDGQTPFNTGQPFSLAITCQLYGFEVAVNGRHLSSHTHRLPIAQTMTVWVRRLKTLENIKYY